MSANETGSVWAFEVPDMSCGHCVGSIQKALALADPQARVQVDLQSHRVEVQGGILDGPAIEAAIRQAGYSPRPLG